MIYKLICLTGVLLAAPWLLAAEDAKPTPKTQVKVLVLTGNEYPGHKWKETAPLLAKFLAEDSRLVTTVNDDPKFLASPRLHDYDCIVLNYMNWESPDPGEEARSNLAKFVSNGKGLVLVHFACGDFSGLAGISEDRRPSL